VNHGSLQLIREPLLDLLEAVVTGSDEALPDLRRWCDANLDVIETVAFGNDYLWTPMSVDRSFEEALAFVRRELDTLDGVRSSTGLDHSTERRYEGLRAMMVDLIERISGRP
jgi:hypothetical protein